MLNEDWREEKLQYTCDTLYTAIMNKQPEHTHAETEEQEPFDDRYLKILDDPDPKVALPAGRAGGSYAETRRMLREQACRLREYVLRHRLTAREPALRRPGSPWDTVEINLYEGPAFTELCRSAATQCAELFGRAEWSEQDIMQIDNKFTQALNQLPTRTVRCKLNAGDYFLAYDYPQLLYLQQLKQACGDNRVDSTEDIPAFCCRDSIGAAGRQSLDKWEKRRDFGVEFRKSGTFEAPQFCKAGRMEAYCRYIVERRRETMVHSPHYQLRASGAGNLAGAREESFCNEDAWYYEMCSGVSLISELAVWMDTLDRLNCERALHAPADSGAPMWKDSFKAAIYLALEDNAERIIFCPAVYWRIACLKRAIYAVNTFCQNLDETWRLKVPVPYPFGPSIPAAGIPNTSRNWENLCLYLFKERLSELYRPVCYFPLPYIPPAGQAGGGADAPCEDPFSYSRLSEQVMSLGKEILDSIVYQTSGVAYAAAKDAKITSLPPIGKEAGDSPYLGFCLSDDAQMKKWKASAERLSQKGIDFKLKKGDRVAEIFTEIHKRLYGGKTDGAENGFLYIDAI